MAEDGESAVLADALEDPFGGRDREGVQARIEGWQACLDRLDLAAVLLLVGAVQSVHAAGRAEVDDMHRIAGRVDLLAGIQVVIEAEPLPEVDGLERRLVPPVVADGEEIKAALPVARGDVGRTLLAVRARGVQVEVALEGTQREEIVVQRIDPELDRRFDLRILRVRDFRGDDMLLLAGEDAADHELAALQAPFEWLATARVPGKVPVRAVGILSIHGDAEDVQPLGRRKRRVLEARADAHSGRPAGRNDTGRDFVVD